MLIEILLVLQVWFHDYSFSVDVWAAGVWEPAQSNSVVGRASTRGSERVEHGMKWAGARGSCCFMQSKCLT